MEKQQHRDDDPKDVDEADRVWLEGRVGEELHEQQSRVVADIPEPEITVMPSRLGIDFLECWHNQTVRGIFLSVAELAVENREKVLGNLEQYNCLVLERGEEEL